MCTETPFRCASTSASLYVPGCLAVAARSPELRRRSGAFGRRRERPPLFGMPRSASVEGCACARPCHPPPGGRSLSIESLAGRLLSADPLGWCRSGRGQGSHQLSLIAPPVHELKKSPPDFVVRIDDEERPVAHAAPVVGHRAARELVLQPPDLVEMATWASGVVVVDHGGSSFC